jgi:hypothetical protein
MINRYRQLCVRCGCHTEHELAEHLQAGWSTPRCPIARLLRECGQVGVQVKIPAVLSLGKKQRELSWHGLMQHLRGRASTAEDDAQLQADMATLETSCNERSIGPILDMLLLGVCPGIASEVLVDLITVLAPYLRSSRGGVMKWWTGAP